MRAASKKMPIAPNKIRQLGAGVLPAVAVALMPKCPLCWIAILGSLGMGSTIGALWLQPLTVFFLLLAVGAIALRARRLHTYGPLILAAGAAIAIYVFKFAAQIDAGVYLSGAMLIGASVWNSILRSVERGPGCSCDKHAAAAGKPVKI